MNRFSVIAGWLEPKEIIGTCEIENARGKEIISFEFDTGWLSEHPGFILDPDIYNMRGRQYPPADKPCFGFLSDCAPDRWGRKLMDRRERIDAKEESRNLRTLMESDYILGVHDKGRIGGIRFYDGANKIYMSDRDTLAAPPMEMLRTLESASLKLESGDENDMGAWEMVAHNLALKCDINIPEAKSMRLSDAGTTFLVKRFDRKGKSRIHYSSAMTRLGLMDGEPAGYLDIAAEIEQSCKKPEENLKELWNRMAFNVCVSNTDDHLRNHGFVLEDDEWTLSPAFDINPSIDKRHMSLLISKTDHIDIKEVIEVSEYFRIEESLAKERVRKMQAVIRDNWEVEATRLCIKRNEQEVMKDAFSQAYISIY